MIETGVALDTHPDAVPGTQLIEIVRNIEKLGFESAFLADAMGREPFVTAAILLANTSKIRIGTGIANIYGRDPMSAAQTRRTLSELYPDRFLMGLGPSNEFLVNLRHGKWVPSLQKIPAYLKELKETQLGSAAPAKLAPVYLSAHGPKMQDIASSLVDGIMTWTMPPQVIARSRKHLGPKPAITAQSPVVLSTNAAEAREVGRNYLALWLGLPWYCKAWVEAGFSEADVSNGGSDALIDSVVAWGDGPAIAKRVSEFEKAGATRVILEPLKKCPPQTTNPIHGEQKVTADWDALKAIAAAVFKK